MSYFEPVGIVASDIPQVGGGGTTITWSGTPAPKKDTGPGFWSKAWEGLVAATPTLTGQQGGGTVAAAPPPGMSTTTKTLLIGGSVVAGVVVLALVLKKK